MLKQRKPNSKILKTVTNIMKKIRKIKRKRLINIWQMKLLKPINRMLTMVIRGQQVIIKIISPTKKIPPKFSRKQMRNCSHLTLLHCPMFPFKKPVKRDNRESSFPQDSLQESKGETAFTAFSNCPFKKQSIKLVL